MRSNSMRKGINDAMRNKLFTEYLNKQSARREKQQQNKTKENENNSN